MDALNVASRLVFAAIITLLLFFLLHFVSSCNDYPLIVFYNDRVLGKIPINFVWSFFLTRVDMHHVPAALHSLAVIGEGKVVVDVKQDLFSDLLLQKLLVLPLFLIGVAADELPAVAQLLLLKFFAVVVLHSSWGSVGNLTIWILEC